MLPTKNKIGEKKFGAMSPQVSRMRERGSKETHIEDMWRHPQNFREIHGGWGYVEVSIIGGHVSKIIKINKNPNNNNSLHLNSSLCKTNTKFKFLNDRDTIHQSPFLLSYFILNQ
jgi:hypothetical protein